VDKNISLVYREVKFGQKVSRETKQNRRKETEAQQQPTTEEEKLE